MNRGFGGASSRAALALGLAWALVGREAFAQAAPTSANSPPTAGAAPTTSEVIVTATRREERAQSVPISITVFNQQRLEDLNVVNSGDLAAFTPSLSVNSQYGDQNSSFAIRGFVQEAGTAPSVGTLFAEVVEPRAPNNADTAGDIAPPGTFFDLQNVQVLKGPQGTLFGVNTTGGDVLLVPQKPTSQLGGYVEGSFGDYDLRGGQAVLNLPVNDRIKLRFGINHESRDGYLDNRSGIGPSKFNDEDFTAVRVSALVDVTNHIQNYSIFSYNRSDTNGFFQKTIACDPAIGLGYFACGQLAKEAADHYGFYDGEQSAAETYSKLRQWQFINTTTWAIGDAVQLKNIVSYAQVHDRLNDPLFGTNLVTPALGGYPSFTVDFAHPGPPPGASTADEDTYTEELQLQGAAWNRRLTYQAGVYFQGSNPLGLEGVQSDILGACSNVSTFQCFDPIGYLTKLVTGVPAHVASANYYEGYTSYRDYAVYSQGSYKYNSQFKLTAGVRYTWDEERNSDTGVAYSGFPYYPTPVDVSTLAQSCSFLGTGAAATNAALVQARCPQSYRLNSRAPTYLVDLDYTPLTNVLTYIKYSRGYRAGVINPNVGVPYNYTRPEKVDTYEIGGKTSFGGPLHGIFDVALFDNEFSNQQLQVGFTANNDAPVSPTAVPLNAGRSRIYGAEVEAALSPLRGLTLDVNYSYLNARILSVPSYPAFSTSAYVVSGPPQAGDRLTLTPTNKVVLNAAYTLPLDPRLARITIGATFTHTDKEIANYADSTLVGTPFAGLSTLPATNLLSLNADWKAVAGSPVDLSFFATNVTGDKYYTFIPGLAPSVGFEVAGLGAPTIYGVRVRYRFGR